MIIASYFRCGLYADGHFTPKFSIKFAVTGGGSSSSTVDMPLKSLVAGDCLVLIVVSGM